jgi:hypothetical protein
MAGIIVRNQRISNEFSVPVRPAKAWPLWSNSAAPIVLGYGCLAGGFIGASADAAIRAGQGDAVAFGRHFIANPDLPRRSSAPRSIATIARPSMAGARPAMSIRSLTAKSMICSGIMLRVLKHSRERRVS